VWIHAAVADMLAPWASAGVDQNFTAYLDKWGVHQRKKHCWGVVQIRNMTATRSGCAGNGRCAAYASKPIYAQLHPFQGHIHLFRSCDEEHFC
jgi:hypothetical protein